MKYNLKAAVLCMYLSAFTVVTGCVPMTSRSSVCAHSNISVEGEHPGKQNVVCDAADEALAYLKGIGLDFSGRLGVVLSQEMPPGAYASAIGQYDPMNGEIRLLDYDTLVSTSRKELLTFGVPMNPAVWRSYVVHELAHAAAHQNFRTGVPVGAASEYIASVAQLATMRSDMREIIIRNYSELSGFEKTGEITYGYYLLDPNRFSVNAYLHYCKPGNGLNFIMFLLQEGLPDD